jgi:hypothetical protein
MENEKLDLDFLKQTIGKVRDEVARLMKETNYGRDYLTLENDNVVEIHQNLMNYEAKLIEKETESRLHQSFKASFISQTKDAKVETINIDRQERGENIISEKVNKQSSGKLLPPIKSNTFHSVRYKKRSNDLVSSYNDAVAINEKIFYKQKLITRRPEDPFHQMSRYRQNEFNRKKHFLKLLKKYQLTEGRDFDNPRTAGCKKVDNSAWKKYCTYNKKYRQDILLDEDRKPLISQFDLDKGLLNLIYKGLVPKDADLSPAFNRETNPLQINVNNLKEIYMSGKVKKDLEITNLLKNIDFHSQDSSMSLFITGDPNNPRSRSRSRNTLHIKDQELQMPDGTKSSKGKRNDTNKNKMFIVSLFNYQFIHDKQYNAFKKKFNNKWKDLNYILQKIAELFKKLTLPNAELDSSKIEKLSDRDFKHINNKDLLNCLTDADLKKHGFQDPVSMYESIQSAFAKKIQSWLRVYLAKKKVSKERHYLNSILKIQDSYRFYIITSEVNRMIEEERSKRVEVWNTTMDTFKANWRNIKSSPRVEIHINSVSCSIDRNCTIDKLKERENNQLSRLISLADPNVEIIYISSYQLTTEVLSYYFSILQTLGIEDAKNRFYLIVPSINTTLPITYSISQLLYFSHKSIQLVKSQIIGRNAYIVPGGMNKYDVLLAQELNCPILAADYSLTGTMFSKSGSKRLLEIGEINSTISAWDITTEDEFYTELTNLIITYPKYNTWVFKINNEFNGRGIATLDLEKSKNVVDLKDNLNGLDGETLNSQLNNLLRKVNPILIL